MFVRLLSKEFPATSGQRCIGFWYNMHGATMGTFNVYVRSNSTGTLTNIFTKSGDQGTAWIDGDASFESSGSYEVLVI
jgi:hypothetical protein